MQDIGLRKMLCVLVVVLCLLPMSAMAATINVGEVGHGGVVDALDNALAKAASGDTLNLVTDINSTLSSSTATNATQFMKSVNIVSNGFQINVNSTILFSSATATTVTFVDPAKFVYQPGGNGFVYNNSLIQIDSAGGTTFSGHKVTVDPRDYNKDPVNITGTGNIFNNRWDIYNVTGVATPANPYAINLSGTGNTVTVNTGTFNATLRGINLIGNSNTLTFNSTNISLWNPTVNKGVKVYLENTATGNTINDVNFVGSNLPNVYIYNGTSVKSTSAWYLYNRTWSSPSWMNMNATINVSNSIPIAGNVRIVANWSNVTYPFNPNNVYRNTTTYQASEFVSNGYTGGWSLNTTENIIFSGNFPAMVPVNISFGNNKFGGQYQQLNIGSVYILNFNPVNSTTPGNNQHFNWTGTTNWTTIPDFTNAQNVTFVVDSGSPSYTLYGNLSFLDPLDLTSASTGAALARLGTALSISTNGNSIALDTSSGTGVPALNKQAILKVYPNTFTVTEGSTNIEVKADGNQIYNKGQYSRAGYLSGSATLTAGNGWISLPVLHFTQYDFGSGTTPYVPPADNGAGAAPGTVSQQQVVQQQIVAETKTVSVNVGGNSAITMVAVTGSGINDVIVTAVPQSELPASITAPATTVYQYIAVTPARFTTISSATFNFKVPASWLADKGFSNKDIALTLWDPDAKTWTSLQTSIVSTNQYETTYQVIVPHMSEFAIVYQKGAAAQAQANVTAIQTSVPLKTATTYMTTTPSIRTTTPTQTQTVPPAASSPPTGGTPLNTMVIAVVGIIVIVVGAFLVHRWWIRKQNPALFKELK